MYDLRDYQIRAIADIRRDLTEVDRTLAVMATGTGKTATFLSWLDECLAAGELGRALIVAHRRELIQQPIDRMVDHFPALAPLSGVVMADRNDVSARVIVATVQTLAARGRMDAILAHGPITHLVVDECFPAGTLVDGRPIETIGVGDRVTAFDDQTGRLATRTVTRTFRRPAPDRMVRIAAGERQIVCTPDHPIYANGQWTPARLIQAGDVLLEVTNARHHLRDLRSNVRADQGQMGYLAQSRSSGVLAGMLGRTQAPCVIGDDGQDQSQIRECADAGTQPYEPAGRASEGKQGAARDGVEANGQTRQWLPDTSAAGVVVCARLADGTGDRDEDAAKLGLSDVLQGGHRQFGAQGGDRDQRAVARVDCAPGAGREEDHLPAVVRVDRVELLECGGRRGPGALCPDGQVYNLEVAGVHTYTANGLIVHNCHHTTAATYRKVIDQLPAAKVLGVTATPLRADGDGLSRVFERVSVRLPISAAIRAGALVPFDALGVQLPISLAGLRETADGWEAEPLGNLLSAANVLEIVIDHWRQYAQGRQTIAFTASVAQAAATAQAFEAAGIKAAFVSGETPLAERDDILKRYSRGDLQLVANCQVLVEGFDAPATSAVLMICPTKSDLAYVQKLGRGLRTSENKSDCRVIDFAPLEDRDVIMAGDVLGKPRDVKQAEAKAQRSGVMCAIGVDALGEAATIDPSRLIVKVLNLLRKDALAWTVDGVYTTATLTADETLCIVMPDTARVAQAEAMRASGPWTPAHEQLLRHIRSCRLYHVNGAARHVGTYADFEGAKAAADLIALDNFDAKLSKRRADWRSKQPSPAQIAFAHRLQIQIPERCTKGGLAQLITHKLTVTRAEKADRAVAKKAMKGQS